MSGLKVLVVGASIAGPATAYWLAKAGARVTVIERFPRLRTGGQAVDIRTAGVSVMRKMTGMEAQVRAKSMQEEGVSFVRDDGRPYGVIRATGNPEQQSIISEYEILRGNLSQVLFDLTQNNDKIEYIFNEQIASMQQSTSLSGPVTVEFLNGTKTSDFDLVVACDGATSRTRAMALECGVRDHIVPTNSWTAYFSIKQDLLHGSKIGQGYSAPGGRFASISADPAGATRVMLMAIFPPSVTDATLPFREASTQGDDALRTYIATHFRGAGWRTDTLLDAMLLADDFYASEIVQVKLPHLHKGRIVLVGDAAFAAGPTGGGTSLALGGAYMLAGELASHPGDLEAGLKGYEMQIRPVVKEFQKIPPLVSSVLAPQTVWGIGIRNWVFAIIAWTGVAEAAQKYLGAAFTSSGNFPLPGYGWVE
ncbi:FAD/NAD(P)-binding domain-containing protein [Ophiobolus disseminans]|uniref:FAD/NAD(P)-binding domain-containing protein n=1 Tax=Ophiobolus disseminans TaxID=1469910 RepID=A0A6A6ZTJ5_9PLEO|nr:FAD/NAD(P)-binding domain-containing protein [Ophiobolus disseminans]